MAFDQIPTSVTIINSGLSGFINISLTNYDASTASAIASGSVVEIAGAFFKASGDITINASSWTAITTATNAYLALTPSGTAGSQVVTAAWVQAAPEWSTAKCGWYTTAGSSIRVVAACYKASNTIYGEKTLIKQRQATYLSNQTYIKNVNIGAWNMDTTASVTLFLSAIDAKNITSFTSAILDDSQAITSPINYNNAGYIQYNMAVDYSLTITRVSSGYYDNAGYSTTGMSRGVITYAYKI